MRDDRLIGYWSEAQLNPSSPELTELGFRCDGSGWLYWSSWSTAFVVYRFTWRMPAPGWPGFPARGCCARPRSRRRRRLARCHRAHT